MRLPVSPDKYLRGPLAWSVWLVYAMPSSAASPSPYLSARTTAATPPSREFRSYSSFAAYNVGIRCERESPSSRKKAASSIPHGVHSISFTICSNDLLPPKCFAWASSITRPSTVAPRPYENVPGSQTRTPASAMTSQNSSTSMSCPRMHFELYTVGAILRRSALAMA